jgi:hypothetical protein
MIHPFDVFRQHIGKRRFEDEAFIRSAYNAALVAVAFAAAVRLRR